MKAKNKFLSILSNLDWYITCAAMAVLILLTFIGVIMRYFFNKPIIWTEEVQLWCIVWVAFLGGGATFRSDGHVAIDVLVDLMPEPIQKAIDVFRYIVVVAVLGYFTVYSTVLVNQLVKTGRETNILDISYGLVYGAFPIGCILMIISFTLLYKKARAKGGE